MGIIFLPFSSMSNVCQTLDVHPPTAGGMHALESKRAYASDLWVKETFFCVVGQLSVWLTLVDPYIGGSKPSFFMVLGSKGWWIYRDIYTTVKIPSRSLTVSFPLNSYPKPNWKGSSSNHPFFRAVGPPTPM